MTLLILDNFTEHLLLEKQNRMAADPTQRQISRWTQLTYHFKHLFIWNNEIQKGKIHNTNSNSEIDYSI